MPIRKLRKKEIKQQRKPWITNRREKLHKKCIKANDIDMVITDIIKS